MALVSKALGLIADRLSDRKFRTSAAASHTRIYNFHIEKTAGTSLNQAMLSLGGEDGAAVYSRMAGLPGHRVVSGDKVFVGWRKRHIEAGHYFYAFSHLPLHAVNLPSDTFTITCFRDPVERVLSHYRERLAILRHGAKGVVSARELRWVRDGFAQYLAMVPRSILCAQLSMFSERMDVAEACEAISGLSHICFVETFKWSIAHLKQKLALPITAAHIRKNGLRVDIDGNDLDRLREMLDDEYRMLERVCDLAGVASLYQGLAHEVREPALVRRAQR